MTPGAGFVSIPALSILDLHEEAMYAIIKTGGKQYRVQENDTIRVEKIDAEAGAIIELDQVLAVANGDDVTFGAPLVAGAKVTVKVVKQELANKLKVFKFKKRKNYRLTRGHRQSLTCLTVQKIATA